MLLSGFELAEVSERDITFVYDTTYGEVSMVNDDVNDNRFYETMGRFPKIEEDEAPLRLLCNEYPKAK